MVHHDSTPKSVLDAPGRTVTVTVASIPRGATRQERRHGVVPPAGLNPKGLARYLRSLAVPNVPVVRAEPRRGRNVRRGRR